MAQALRRQDGSPGLSTRTRVPSLTQNQVPKPSEELCPGDTGSVPAGGGSARNWNGDFVLGVLRKTQAAGAPVMGGGEGEPESPGSIRPEQGRGSPGRGPVAHTLGALGPV